MHALYEAERSPIAKSSTVDYQSFGLGKRFLKDHAVDTEQLIRQCAIVDLTNLSRVGFRGVDTENFLKNKGFKLPEQPNVAVLQTDGTWVARFSMTEYCILGSLDDFGERVSLLENTWKIDDQINYLLPRQDSHAWIQLTGHAISEVMAKLCAVDLRPDVFAVGQVAQTSVAKINAIVMNVSDEQAPKFNLLCDRASSLYLWGVLQDAIQEFNGQVVGIDGLI